MMNGGKSLRETQAGQALVIFALAAVFLAAIAALAIDGGVVEANRRALQSITDGAALAGAARLNASSTSADQMAARKAAVLYAISGTTGGSAVGSLPGTCDPSADISPGSPCDPTGYSLTVRTPPPGDPGRLDRIDVELTQVTSAGLGAAVGLRDPTIFARAIAQNFLGPNVFPYALFANGNITDNGNTDSTVAGNVYVRGCIELNTSDHLFVGASPVNNQPGTVQVRGQDPQGNPVGPQVWTSGSGSGCNGAVCTTNAYAPHTTCPTPQNQPGLQYPGSWAAGGYIAGAGGNESCGTAPNVVVACPASSLPVPNVPTPTFPSAKDTSISPTGSPVCDQAHALPFPTTPATVIPGCYDACSVGAKNINGGNFTSGTYAFVGNGTANACGPVFAKGSNSQSTGTLGDGTGGVTFWLYNGASWCASPCGDSSGGGTLSFNAPTSGPDTGIVIYDCNGQNCAGTHGSIDVQSPSWSIILGNPGAIYAPADDCIIHSNANLQVDGQVICNNVALQGGAVSAGGNVTFGGTGLPVTGLNVQLIE